MAVTVWGLTISVLRGRWDESLGLHGAHLQYTRQKIVMVRPGWEMSVPSREGEGTSGSVSEKTWCFVGIFHAVSSNFILLKDSMKTVPATQPLMVLYHINIGYPSSMKTVMVVAKAHPVSAVTPKLKKDRKLGSFQKPTQVMPNRFFTRHVRITGLGRHGTVQPGYRA